MQSRANVLAMTCVESAEPPRFASAGPDKWMRRNVVMNGVGRWESFVSAGDNHRLGGEGVGRRYDGKEDGAGMAERERSQC